jgi:precorrin-6x reductase
LLTIGSSNLALFTGKIADYKNRLFVRVLPESRVIAKCEQTGLTAQNIIALKGPFTEEMNTELLRYCNAKVLVTKDSGAVGGIEEKLAAASKMDIPTIIVERPEIVYPEKTSSISEVIKFVQGILFY